MVCRDLIKSEKMKMNTEADINAHQSWQIVETLGLYLLRLLDESMKEQTNLSRYSYIFYVHISLRR